MSLEAGALALSLVVDVRRCSPSDWLELTDLPMHEISPPTDRPTCPPAASQPA